jgi:hypothetical protein
MNLVESNIYLIFYKSHRFFLSILVYFHFFNSYIYFPIMHLQKTCVEQFFYYYEIDDDYHVIIRGGIFEIMEVSRAQIITQTRIKQRT